MGVLVDPAVPEIEQMGTDYQQDSRNQQPDMQAVPGLFGQQKTDSCAEKCERQQPVVMAAVPVVEGDGPDDECQPDHYIFK
jgi:hypothetical protein